MDKNNKKQNNKNKGEDIKEKMKRDSKSEDSKKGMFWTIVIAIVVVVIGGWIWGSSANAPSTPSDTSTSTDEEVSTTTEEGPELGEDSTQDIQDQLEGINIEDIEGEFQDVDQDIQNLES